MTKFVMTYRRSFDTARRAREEGLKTLETAFEQINATGDIQIASALPDLPSPRTRSSTLIFDMDRSKVDELERRMPNDVLIEEVVEYTKLEENVPFDLLRVGPADVSDQLRAAPLHNGYAGKGRCIKIEVFGARRSHERLPGAEVHVFVDGSGGVRERITLRTDNSGTAMLDLADFYRIRSIIAVPYAHFWAKELRGDPGRSTQMRAVCELLPTNGPGGWWHDALYPRLNVDNGKTPEGKPIKVGVIDSGCGPSPALGHVKDGGKFLDGHYSSAGFDTGSHGTHVCGIIGARIANTAVPFQGIAPGVELHSVGVFPPDGRANQGDIANAIDYLVEEQGVDLINMSLGSNVGSKILEDAINAAFNAGTLCVCAAGNAAGPVYHPARLPQTIAVSSIGKTGRVPLDAQPGYPAENALFGSDDLYAAAFTNYGPEIDFAGPGVGIIAPVPDRFGTEHCFTAMSGTSMAAPAVCARIAILLAEDPNYVKMPPSEQRSRFVRNLAISKAVSLGLPRNYEGRGLPARN